MNKPVVTVIMPCCNAAKYLADSIESVIAQTYQNWELLVIDDCSTDNSAEIVSAYASKDSRIRMFQTERNSGSATVPWNIGIQNAQGRYIAFLDADDEWFPEKLQQQLPLFDSPEVAVVFSNYEKMDAEGKRSGRIVKAPVLLTYQKLLQSNAIGNLTGIYDSEKAGKGHMPDLHHEDYAFWLSILKQGFVAKNTNTVLAAYRVTVKSLSGNKLKAILWTWIIYRKSEKLAFPAACYYFMHYAVRSGLKFLK